MDTRLSERPTDELERIMAETASCLADVRQELDRRRQAAQTIEIENLDVHLAEARVRWSELKRFLDIVLRELRK